MDRSTTDRGDESLAAEAGKGANWKRKRESFSCTKEIWDHAKTAWSVVRSDYPAWTEWLEAALREKAASVQSQLTPGDDSPLPRAPSRLPTGRREPALEPVDRERRSFTCAPAVWSDARAAWWAQSPDYPSWSDWVEEAIVEKTKKSDKSTTTTTH